MFTIYSTDKGYLSPIQKDVKKEDLGKIVKTIYNDDTGAEVGYVLKNGNYALEQK